MANGAVIVHHEGAGAPTDNVERMGKKRYSIVIGVSKYTLRYSPERSFVTTEAGLGHTLQLGLTGNRENHPVTDTDLNLIRAAMRAARTQGWVTDRPAVTFHGDHEQTSCPGRHAEARRADIVAACHAVVPPPPTPPSPPASPPPTFEYAEDQMRSALLPIGPLDRNGSGWGDWDPGLGRDPLPGSMQATLHGPSPADDGYWYVDVIPVIATQARDGKVRISLVHGKPGSTINVHVQAA